MQNKNTKFNQLNISSQMVETLSACGYEYMTPIQEQSLPLILENNDIIAKAKTGSGKTAAFGIGLLNKLNVKRFRIQSLIICPTRELADQVAVELRKLARFQHNIKILTLSGGVPFKPQEHSLSHQAHIVVGTPGRILRHLKNNNFNPQDINTLVLDEADRMLDMGFSDEIEELLSYIPKDRQTLLFSATYPQNIKDLANNILKNPKTVEVESIHQKNSIVQDFYEIPEYKKFEAVQKILNHYQPTSIVIFCNTKISCDELADDLYDIGVDSLVLHSDLDQKQRNETLIMFANQSYPILIATDVASRGLDIKDIDLVLNYDLPFDSEVYIHRIGRTARAGAKGKAVSLVTSQIQFDELQEYLEDNITLKELTSLNTNEKYNLISNYSTLFINGGKKQKIRAGDILGALTAGVGLDKNDIGKINILDLCSFVAVKKNVEQKALDGLNNGKIKGKYFRVFLK